MVKLFSGKSTACALFLFPIVSVFSLEENFFLIDGKTEEMIMELGSDIEERVSPCSTFKITLSLMGYDAGILVDQVTPTWDFQKGYDDFLPSSRQPINPSTWMQYSCVWYSKVLAGYLGIEKMQSYLDGMEYGNKDLSGSSATDTTWINSSIKISPKEQVHFLKQMIEGNLPISQKAIQMTKEILFKEELGLGWKLYGKTGWSGSDITRDGKTLQFGWFVGWIENGDRFFPFAYLIRNDKIQLDQRIPRVKELLQQASLYN
jgi:beta-lactamase class D